MLYIYNPNSKHFVTNDHYFIRFTKKKFVYTTTSYNNPPYDAKSKNLNENTLIRNLSKEHPGLKILKTQHFERFLKTKPNELRKTIPVINFNTIHEKYVYRSTILEYYQMFKNSITTLINNIIDYDNMLKVKGKHDTNHFVIMEIPDTLYSLPILEKYSKYETPTTEMVKVFFDTSRLLLLEFFKLLDDDVTTTSVFYKLIETNKAKNVTIVLTKHDKGVFINLKDLYSFLKLSKYENSSKVKGHELQKLFFYMLKTVLLMPGFTPEDIDDNKYGDKLVKLVNKEQPKEEDTPITIVEDNDIIKHVTKDLKKEDVNVLDIVENDLKEDDNSITPVPVYKSKYDKHTTIDDINDLPIEDATFSMLEELADNKVLPKPKYKKLVELVKEGLNKPSPFKDGKKIKDLTVITKEELTFKEEDAKLPLTNTLSNPKDGEDPLGVRNRKYIKEVYKKDIISTFASLNKSGLIVKDMQRTTHDDILGAYEEYVISVNDMGKSNYDIKVKLPIIDEDGTYKISGNKYILRVNRGDVPIKKIDFNRVSLTSAYGKVFIDRAPAKKLDRGFAIKRQLLKQAEANLIKNFVAGNLKLIDIKTPSDYSSIGRYVKSFKYNDFLFNFSYYKRKDIIGDKKLEDIEQGKYVVCGTYKDNILLMDYDNNIVIYKNKKYDIVDTIPNMLKLDMSKVRPEYSLIKVHKKYVSIALMLSYYLGLFNLLKLLNVNYKVLEGGRVRVKEDNIIVLRFKFNTVVIERSTPENDIILEGFDYEDKELRKVDIDVVNNKPLFKTIFNELGLPLSSVTEIELYENMFVDPVTKTVLEDMKEPTTFIKLLIRASEMLLDDFYHHPNSLKGYSLKGYERIPQYVYKTMVESIKKKKNEEFFGRSRLTVDPYATWRIVNEDSAASLIEDINPIALLKQKEDTTYLGFGARSKESLAASTRELHVDDIGVISESSKDSGDVGITAYMSANPVIHNLRGIRDKDNKPLVMSNILSTSSMLAPFSMMDDPKRSNGYKRSPLEIVLNYLPNCGEESLI
jgi:hypothetical protein